LSSRLKSIYREQSDAVDGLSNGSPVTHVYNPLAYARDPAEQYFDLAGQGRNPVLLLGMNPGPWGMAQTGVPFGAVSFVRDWMGIEGPVGKPREEHPKRPVLGFEVQREEVSGMRFWGWAQQRFGTPERFFERFFVANYCPLVFMEKTGRNRTPDKLPLHERHRLFEICDRALTEIVAILEPQQVIGIGKFAEDRARRALSGSGVTVNRILHPSPASPVANRGWMERAERQLKSLGVELPC
jgi:single-strand selective monofunctional uracil DNA glycosylase